MTIRSDTQERPAATIISIADTSHTRGGDRLERYDEEQTPFDVERRVKPDSTMYDAYDQYARRLDLETYAATTLEGIALADVNLRTRGLIGIVLGSAIHDLTEPPEDLFSLRHSDFDVLILQHHSRHNPAPNEWGIDWWVRPERDIERKTANYRNPTNGRAKLWYDIALKEHIPIADDADRQEKVSLDPASAVITVRNNMTYSRLHEDECIEEGILPGLYLPDAVTMDCIVEHCHQKALRISQEITTLADAIHVKIERLLSTVYFRFLAAEQPRDIMHTLFAYATELEEDLARGYLLLDSQTEHIPVRQRFADTDNYPYDYWEDRVTNYLRTQLHSLQSRCHDLINRNFDYLRIQDGEHTASLLPVIPHAVLSFRGL